MATYRFPAASPSTSAVDMLLKGIALRQAMNREERGEAQDTREAALNALRMQQSQQGIAQNALVLEEARRAMGEEAAVREAMPALRAAPPTSIATMPGQAAVQAQFAPPEGPVETGTPLPNMEPGVGVFQTAPARPAVEPRSILAFTEPGLMEAAGGPAGYERLKRTRTGQAFLAERKPLSAVDVEKRVRVEKARGAWLAALEEAEQHRNTLDPTGMNMVRALDAMTKGLRIVAEVDARPENVTKVIAELTERRDKLAKDENARLLIAEDQRKVVPALQKWLGQRTPENLAGYTTALLSARSPEIRKQGFTFMQADATDALKTFRRDQETVRFAPFLDAVRARVVALHGQGKDWDPDLWFAAGQQVMAEAQAKAAGGDTAARALLDSANATLMRAVEGKGKGENLGKLFFKDPKSQLPIWNKAVEIVRQSGVEEDDPSFIDAVLARVKEMTAAGVRTSAAPRPQFWQSPHKRLQELQMLNRGLNQDIAAARAQIKELNAGVTLRSKLESPEHLAKLRPFEEAIANAEAQKSANREEMARLGSGIAPPEPKPKTTTLTANPPPVGVDPQALRSAMKTESARLLAFPGATPESVKAAMRLAGWK